MTVFARYDGPRTVDYITPGRLYEVIRELNNGFWWIDDDGMRQFSRWLSAAHLKGRKWTRVEIAEGPELYVGPEGIVERPGEPAPRKWFTVPDYRPNGDPATSATVVNRAGQQVAHFESIADAEAAVDAVNGRNHDKLFNRNRGGVTPGRRTRTDRAGGGN